MASQPSLDGLSIEIIEAIVAKLTFADVCQLRLTTRELAAKSSHGSFKAHFITKTVHLSSARELEIFGGVTQSGWQGCALQNLTVVGLALSADRANLNDTGERQNQSRADLLAKALTNLRLNSARGRLGSLTLVIDFQTQDGLCIPLKKVRDWKSVWESAAQTFTIVSCALQTSAIPLEKFDVFDSVDRCSLGSNRIGSVLELLDLSVPLQALKILSLSVSQREARNCENETSASSQGSGQLSQYISRFFEQCPKLERLHLSWFNLRLTGLTDAEQEERRFFDHAIGPAALPLLQEITLKGIYTSEKSLVSFFEDHRGLRNVNFEELHLEVGSFRPVFDYMTGCLKHLDSVHLDDLWETRLIQFPSAPGEPHSPHPGGPTWIARAGAESRKPIKYQLVKGRIKGSSKVMLWHKKKNVLYGPP